MTGATLETRIRRLRPDRTTAVAAALVLFVEVLLAVQYALRPDIRITNPLILAYPFVWIDVAAVAVLTTRRPQTTRRRRYAGVAVAAAYFVVLAYFGGLVGPGSDMAVARISTSLPPGYSPAVLYNGPALHLVLEPYKVVGYLALTYLVYVTVLDAAGAAFSGVVGLFSCVSCTWPILGTVASSIFGGGSAIAAVALGQAYGLSTLVFVSAAFFLWWRPTL